MTTEIEEMYEQIISEMLVDCESRHTGHCYQDCRKDAQDYLDHYTKMVADSAYQEWVNDPMQHVDYYA